MSTKGSSESDREFRPAHRMGDTQNGWDKYWKSVLYCKKRRGTGVNDTLVCLPPFVLFATLRKLLKSLLCSTTVYWQSYHFERFPGIFEMHGAWHFANGHYLRSIILFPYHQGGSKRGSSISSVLSSSLTVFDNPHLSELIQDFNPAVISVSAYPSQLTKLHGLKQKNKSHFIQNAKGREWWTWKAEEAKFQETWHEHLLKIAMGKYSSSLNIQKEYTVLIFRKRKTFKL